MKRLVFIVMLSAAIIAGVSAYNKKSNGVMEFALASPIPANTEWGKALAELSQEWSRITNGEIKLIIHPNGRLGNENQVIQQMDSGVLDAAVLTSFGLNAITKKKENIVTKQPSTPSAGILTISCPFLIRTDGELDAVLTQLKPDLEAKINEKGYYTVAWARAGWVKIFARSAVRTPEDLRKLFLGTAPGEDELKEVFERMGFKLREVEQKDMLVKLTNRTIEAVYQSPISAGGQQIVGVANYMMDLNIAPFMGGIVFTQRSWDAIPDKYKAALFEASKRMERRIDGAIKNLEDQVLETVETKMKGKFFAIELTLQQKQQWYDLVQTALAADPKTGRKGLIGTTFDKDTYEKITAILAAARR